MTNIHQEYKKRCINPSDIYEHLPTLYELAKTVNSISEFGVRGGNSTYAFAKGLLENELPGPKTLFSLDMEEPLFDYDKLQKEVHVAKPNISMHFEKASSLHTAPRIAELLFIDTHHTYGVLKRELARHHLFATKYIVMHDTEIFRHVSECSFNTPLNLKYDPDLLTKIAKDYGGNLAEENIGLLPAILEHITFNSEWSIKKEYSNNNGLTILERTAF